jgi:hypothetical protein
VIVDRLAHLPPAVQLRGEYDVERLRRDLRALEDAPWRHKAAYSSAPEGPRTGQQAWSCLPLHNQGGDPARTDPGGPGTADFAPTPWLERAPYLREVVTGLPGRLRSARLLGLAPGGCSALHRDTPYGFASGWLRLHVPITTNSAATLVIDDETHHWAPGNLWYGDFDRPHKVENRGGSTRVHLVVDVDVTTDVLDLFPAHYVRALPSEEILYRRPELPLRDACRFAVPGGQYLFATEPWPAVGPEPCVATVQPAGDGRLRLTTTDGVEVTLVHTGGGTFRYLGWTDMHTLAVRPKATSAAVRWRYRAGAVRVDAACRPAVTSRPQPAGRGTA